MNRLFWRIFLVFWLSTAVIVAMGVTVSFLLAARHLDSADFRHPAEVTVDAAMALQSGGRDGLERWLRQQRSAGPRWTLYILDDTGRDLLGRTLPPPVRHRAHRAMERPHAADEPERARKRVPMLAGPEGAPDRPLAERRPGKPPVAGEGQRRPKRRAPVLFGPDGEEFLLVPARPRAPGPFGGFVPAQIPLAVLGIGLLVSALACLLLSRYITRPVQRLRAATLELASGRLDTRVLPEPGRRRDVIAQLGRDFDAMAVRLQSLLESRQRLFRDLSHELRSPLARQRVAVELARGRGQLPELDRIELECERLDALIGQIMELVRLEDDAESLALETTDLTELVDEIVADARYEAAARNVTVAWTPGDEVPAAVDRRLFASAVENVLRNALRYAPEDSIVDVVADARDAVWTLRIRDHGPGVPTESLARIFEPFHRVGDDRDRESGGEGIGLAITERVLRRHGGRAEAGLPPGGGLEVALHLPRATA